jgi:succinylarginine dihydrolase
MRCSARWPASAPTWPRCASIPHECRENAAVSRYLEGLVASGGPIDELVEFDLRQSMRNGGGPACLRLRVALTDDEAASMHQGVIMSEELYAKLVPWVERHYRDQVEPKDLADPQLAIECATALEELERLLGLPGLYQLD